MSDHKPTAGRDLDGLTEEVRELEVKAHRAEMERLFPEGSRALCQDGHHAREVTIAGHRPDSGEILVRDDDGLEYRVRLKTLRATPQDGDAAGD